MKHFFTKQSSLPALIFGLLLVTCQNSKSKNEPIKKLSKTTAKIVIDDTISNIDAICQQINSDSVSYKAIEIEIQDQSTEGGSATRFYSGDTLKRMKVEFFGEMGKLERNYYFDDNNLILLVENQTEYTSPMYMNGSKVKNSFVEKYYFFENKLVSWVASDGQVKERSQYIYKEAEINENLQLVNTYK